MQIESRKTTLVEDVYHQVRGDLLAARFKPGQWLRLPLLTEKYGVSLSVAREAVTRLVSEGIVQAVPQRGFRVAELSMEDLKDLTDARISVEILVLRDSLTYGDRRWEAELLAAHHLLEHTPMRDPESNQFNRDFVPVHASFHHALLAGCPNQTLLKVAHDLRERSELYRMWAPTTSRSVRDIVREHQQLTELALARDVEATAELLERHIDHTKQALIESR